MPRRKFPGQTYLASMLKDVEYTDLDELTFRALRVHSLYDKHKGELRGLDHLEYRTVFDLFEQLIAQYDSQILGGHYLQPTYQTAESGWGDPRELKGLTLSLPDSDVELVDRPKKPWFGGFTKIQPGFGRGEDNPIRLIKLHGHFSSQFHVPFLKGESGWVDKEYVRKNDKGYFFSGDGWFVGLGEHFNQGNFTAYHINNDKRLVLGKASGKTLRNDVLDNFREYELSQNAARHS
jgi:hypothetical protein